MRCEHAQRLFDAYVDGELAPSQATELGAHRVRCPECRRALALLEVTGHVLASDEDPVSIPDGFSDRLLACMQEPKRRERHRLRQIIYLGAPLAAAAVIALAFLGVFDGNEHHVAGRIETITNPPIQNERLPSTVDGESAAERAMDDFASQTSENINAKLQSGEALQDAAMTVLQWLDVLESAQKDSDIQPHYPGVDELVPEKEQAESPPVDGSEDR